MSDFDVQTGPGRAFIAGEIDMSVTDELRRALASAAAADGCTVMVDLSAATFIDSSGLNEFLRLTNAGHAVTLRGTTPPVRRVIELVGLDRVFVLED